MTREQQQYCIAFGGQSTEHDASRKGFEYLYERLRLHPLPYATLALVCYITRAGKAILNEPDFTQSSVSYEDGEPMELLDAFRLLKAQFLFVYSLLHGQYGEDGCIQGVAKFFQIRGNFGEPLSCGLGMSKYHMSRYVEGTCPSVRIPYTVRLGKNEDPRQKLSLFQGKTLVVKPNSLGASILTERFVFNTQTEQAILALCARIHQYDTHVLLQEYIQGAEYSCGCLERHGRIDVLPLVNILTPTNFFGHKEKHTGGLSEERLIPCDEETTLLQRLKETARDLYSDLGFQNAARFDFLLTKDDLYFLEVNPLPGVMKNSILPKMLRTQGLEVEDLIAISLENECQRPGVKTELSYHID